MSVAVLGAGNWGKNLIREFDKQGALSTVVEPDTTKHPGLKNSYPHVKVLASREGLPADVTAVAIATPVPSHFADILWALDAGLDIFVEKPMVGSLAQATDLQSRLKSSDRVLMVGHLLLYQPAIRWIDSFLQTKGLGEIVSVHQRRLNHGKVRTQENVLWSFGVHDIAVLLYLLKTPPLKVGAAGHAYHQPGIEDQVFLSCTFPGNLRSTLEVNWTWPVKERSLTVIGTEGTLVFDELKQTVTLHQKRFSSQMESIDEGSRLVFEQKEEALPFELRHFLDCLKSRQTPLSDYRNGLEVLSVLDRADRALRSL